MLKKKKLKMQVNRSKIKKYNRNRKQEANKREKMYNNKQIYMNEHLITIQSTSKGKLATVCIAKKVSFNMRCSCDSADCLLLECSQ